MKRKPTIHYATAALSATLLLVSANQASAGPIRIDFGDSDATGEDWGVPGPDGTGAFDDGIDFSAQTVPGVAQGSLTFNMRVGGVIYSDYCVIEDGAVWLSTSACTTSPSGAAFTVLGADFASTNSLSAVDLGSVSASPGRVDVVAPIGDEPDSSSPQYVDVMRFLWNGVQPPGADPDADPRFFLQATFFDVGGGDFDVEFSYGTGEFPATYAGGTQSIVDFDSGTPIFTGVSPFVSSTDYLFSFRGGVCTVGCTTKPPPESVPEPTTLLLLSGGLLGLAFGRSKRRAASNAA